MSQADGKPQSTQLSSSEQAAPSPTPRKRARFNQHTRRSFIAMFLAGRSVGEIVRSFADELPRRGSHAMVEQELREDMIAGGSLERCRKPPASETGQLRRDARAAS